MGRNGLSISTSFFSGGKVITNLAGLKVTTHIHPRPMIHGIILSSRSGILGAATESMASHTGEMIGGVLCMAFMDIFQNMSRFSLEESMKTTLW
jgi:hypothetical protein